MSSEGLWFLCWPVAWPLRGQAPLPGNFMANPRAMWRRDALGRLTHRRFSAPLHHSRPHSSCMEGTGKTKRESGNDKRVDRNDKRQKWRRQERKNKECRIAPNRPKGGKRERAPRLMARPRGGPAQGRNSRERKQSERSEALPPRATKRSPDRAKAPRQMMNNI